MMNNRRQLPDATYLGTASPSFVRIEGYPQERLPSYMTSPRPTTPASSLRSATPKTVPPSGDYFTMMSPRTTTNSSVTFRDITDESTNYAPPTPHRGFLPLTPQAGPNSNVTFRDITDESENYAPPISQRGFLPLTSPAGHLSGVGDGKLVSRLYGRIETQDSELERLKFQYSEEQRRREQVEIELAEANEEIKENKKKINDYRKQEREHRNKAELDHKERYRDEMDRWERTMDEMAQLRKDLTIKNQKVSEFEFLCLTLQQNLDKEKEKSRTDLSETEKRVTLSSEMLQTCHGQLSRVDKQLRKERKMKQILIKINEALQMEIKRLQEQIVHIKQHAEYQLSQSLSTQQSKETEDHTSQIIKELQIEDALFYFEEVKQQYEDRPKVYRIFLEIIRDYKGRTLSTPEVIARISKLFQGNSKLVIGFNRFLPKDYWISEQDVADMQGYNGAAVARAKEAIPGPGSIVVANSTDVSLSLASSTRRKGSDASNVSVVPKGRSEEALEVVAQRQQNKAENPKKATRHDPQGANEGMKKNLRRKTEKSHSFAKISKSTIVKKGSREKKATKETTTIGGARLCETPELSYSLTDSLPTTLSIDTSASIEDRVAANPPVKNPPGDCTDDDNDTASSPEMAIASPAMAEIASPKFEHFQSFNLSAVTSSQVFGGIESIGDSFGIEILPSHQTSSSYTPSDRYEVIEDQELNAIEMIVDHHSVYRSTVSESSITRDSRSSNSSSYWNKL